MSQSLVQTGAEIVVSGGTSGFVTLNGVGAGNLLTVVSAATSPGTVTASDNQANAWANASQANDPFASRAAAILYAKNAKGGNTTVTVTYSGSAFFNAFVQEWSGSDTAAPLAAADNFWQSSVSSTAQEGSSAGINPGAPCIVLVVGSSENSGAGSPGTGYTSISSGAVNEFYEYRIFASAPSNEHGAWTTSPADQSISVIAAFKAAATVTYPAPQPIIVPPEPFPFSAFSYL